MAKSVLAAMSGGVDSSVAALLLKEQGYNVVGAHMKLWDYAEVGADVYRDGRCCSLDSVNDCRAVCDRIDSPFYVLNLSREFRREVIDNFVDEYKSGRTPNPCVRCNTKVKWKPFLQKAREIGCDYIATGHYTRIGSDDTGRFLIRKGVDDTRDQSYFLWGLTQEMLSMTLTPLGGLHKTEVREIARRHGLKTAEKTESREICFVADDNYHRFLREWDAKHDTAEQPGEIVDQSGRVLGQHDGAAYFTIGQRRGLGISHPTPLYVLDIDAANNRVIVGDDSSLFRDEMVVENVNWITLPPGMRLPRHEDANISAPRNDDQAGPSQSDQNHIRHSGRSPIPHPERSPIPHPERSPIPHPERSRRVANNGSSHSERTPPSKAGRNPCPEGVVLSGEEGRGFDTDENAGSKSGGSPSTVGSDEPTMNGGPPKALLDVTVKIRYQHPPAKAQLTALTDSSVRVTFEQKQRAITPGQSAVFYDNDVLLGGGVIK